MIDIVGTLGQSIFSGLCMLIAASFLSAGLYPIFHRCNAKLNLQNQSLASLCYVLIAPVSSFLAVVVLTHPSIAATLVYEHCHGTNCSPHVPSPITTSTSGAVLVALAIIAMICATYLMSKTLLVSRTRQMFLQALSKPGTPAEKQYMPDYRLIESEDPVAWCAGLFFPSVYISTGLVKKLTYTQLHAILAHEYGHVARRDNLRKLLLKWSSAFWFPSTRDSIRERTVWLMEQLADHDSARITGQPELVKQVYALFQSPTQAPTYIYQHRNRPADNFSNALSPTRFTTIAVYLMLVIVFVVMTAGLTMAAHGLLEEIGAHF